MPTTSHVNAQIIPHTAQITHYDDRPPHPFWPHPGAAGYIYMVDAALGLPRNVVLPPPLCAFCGQKPRGRDNSDLTAMRPVPRGWRLEYLPKNDPPAILWRCHKHVNTAIVHATLLQLPQRTGNPSVV